MMYNNMQNFPGRRGDAFSPIRRILTAIFLCVFLVITVLLYFLALPAWQLRLRGVQTSALARASSVCSSDDDSSDSYVFTYTFTGPQGKQYQITHDSFCTNVINDGDRVTVWYMPDNPTNILTTPEAILLYVFSGLGGGMDLACLIVMLLTFRSGLRARRRRDMYNYANMGL